MIRSLLYVPGSSDKFLSKAHERGADAVIIDLEDAVAPNAKAQARERLSHWVPKVGEGGAKVFVRINAEPELIVPDATAACRAGAYGLYVPKVGSPNILEQLDAALTPIEAEMAREATVLVPLIEDPAAIFEARSIARAGRVLALSAGGEDLATAMGAQPTPEVLRLPKLMIHMAAKAERVLSFGLMRTVADYSDSDSMRAAAREAREFGFDGASCIHPSVVSILNEAFSPSAKEIEWAHKVVAADAEASASGIGAFTLEGRFVDAPIVERARATLARFEADSGKPA